MGFEFRNLTTILCTLLLLAPTGAWAESTPAAAAGSTPAAGGGGAEQGGDGAGCAAIQVNGPVNQQAVCESIIRNYDACTQSYHTSVASARSGQSAGMAFQARVVGNTHQAQQQVGGGEAADATASIEGAAPHVQASNAQAQGCVGHASEAERTAATMAALSKQSAQYRCTTTKLAAPTAHKKVLADCNKMLADNKGIMSGLKKAALPLAALAAGGLAGYLLGKGSGDKDKGKDKGSSGGAAPHAGGPEAAAAETDCGPNAVSQNGICVVKSENDKCSNEEEVRDAEGKCVAKANLCKEGFEFDEATETCKKNVCEIGKVENDEGFCVARGDGKPGGSGAIQIGARDPFTGELLEDDTGSEGGLGADDGSGALAGGATDTGAASSAREGRGNMRGATAGGDRGVSSFQSGASKTPGASTFGGNFGAALSKGSAEGGEAEVQYQPVKWKNPKQEKELWDVIKSK
jgi:hypothetical protein